MAESYEERQQEKAEEVTKLCSDLFRMLNGGDVVLIRGAVSEYIRKEHSTLQQLFFRLMAGVIEDYSKHEYTDARNEASVAWAKKVAEIEARFPLI